MPSATKPPATPREPEDQGLMTIAEARDMVGVGTLSAVYDRIKKGKLPVYYRFGVKVVSRADIELWRAERRATLLRQLART